MADKPISKRPVRIQRKRTKGWKMPENTVSVTRPVNLTVTVHNPPGVRSEVSLHPDAPEPAP
jgi:hypothetical protein